MKSKVRYEVFLIITYMVMVGVFLCLTFLGSSTPSISNVIVNAAMFIIVGLIFLYSVQNSLTPTAAATVDLGRAKDKIEKDAVASQGYLFRHYEEQREVLFSDKNLTRRYTDYLKEVERVSRNDKAYYKTNIDEYINYDLVDSIVHRNILNQIPGVMTGLGILGTFIGLSLGLQSFNTGSTAEITGSIEPLMDGIKVAFHTSIYGMIFSLVYNYVLKRRIDDAESAVKDFLNAYKKYVLPDTGSEGFNRMIELQKREYDALKSMSESVGEGLSENLSYEFDRFNKNIADFANMATKNQMDAMSMVVDNFIKQMNASLEHSFTKLGQTVNQAYVSQQENARQMNEILAKTGNASENLDEIERRTANLLGALGSYVEDVKHVQEGISADTAVMARYIDKQNLLIEKLNASVEQMPKRIDESMRLVNDNMVEISQDYNRNLSRASKAAEALTEAMETQKRRG
ncbi:MAG: MotA/TolQ/ExbB proton channel family protein [Lachnospiraceae bacterium]|nr:MotA/TolQ/ExbB proton channel family protein [Lachnospiraceae bacterium]